MPRLLLRSALIALAIACLAPSTGSAAPTTAGYQREVATLRREKASLVRSNARLRVELGRSKARTAARDAQIASLEAKAIATTNELSVAAVRVATLTADLVTMTTARDTALLGLPAAIHAVPLARFSELVFAPSLAATSRDSCGDSVYSSDGYTSYSFNQGKFCS